MESNASMEPTTAVAPQRAAAADSPPPTMLDAARRIHYSAPLVFGLGGVVGSALGLGIAVLMHYLMRQRHPLFSYAVGTLINQLFHHVYYHVVFVNQEIRLRTPLWMQLLLYLAVAVLSMVPLSMLMDDVGMTFLPAIVCSTALLSLVNIVLIRVSTFSSASLAEVAYAHVDEDFYDAQADAHQVGWFRAWYHNSRHEHLARFVEAHYRHGMRIADLGCGNCRWNEIHLPVVGVDINEKMLAWAQRKGRLIDYRVCPGLVGTGLSDGHFDLVVLSETLEHLLNYEQVLAEVRRILKDGGKLLITVPYDFFLGPFFMLFNVNCAYQGYVKGSMYHRYRCGHINHFTKSRLRKVLSAAGFRLDRLFVVNGLLLYGVAKKEP